MSILVSQPFSLGTDSEACDMYRVIICCTWFVHMQEYSEYTRLHPMKGTTECPVVVVPLLMYTDDTSGKRSKNGTNLTNGVSCLLASHTVRMPRCTTFIL